MKVSQVQNFQTFGKINKKNSKKSNEVLISQEEKEYFEKAEMEAIKMNTAASVAIAATLLAGMLGAGIAMHSSFYRPEKNEYPSIPADIEDSSYNDIPEIQFPSNIDITA